MGLFDRIFGSRKERIEARQTFELLNGYSPHFRTWGGEIYESELVRAAIDARARHISKLDVTIQGTAKPGLQSKLRLGPNEWQTWSQFMYRLSTILDAQTTAFIVPVMDRSGETTGIYPILPDRTELVQFNDRPWMRFYFARGHNAAIELNKVGIMTKYQYRDDLFGSGNMAINPTMKLINIQKQGIEEGVKSAASYRFMATLANFSNDKDLTLERQRFTRENLEQGGGVLLWPNTYKDIKQIDSKPYVPDADQMKVINESVYNYFGVNEDVLQNKTVGDAWSAFYEGAIEPFAVQFSEVVTRMLFSMRERELGASVMATANRLQYMTNQDKLNVSAQMADRGLMTRNEIREIWNLAPLPAEIGDTLPVRGEYYNLGETGEDTNGEE